MFRQGSRILFQGDSITDAGRDRGSSEPNDAAAMGKGYAFLIMARALRDLPERELCFYNRGISGNRVPDLEQRWHTDTVGLEPAVLSILIGVNDLWHKLEGRYPGSVTDFEAGYRALLERTRRSLPKARLIVCEPFVLRAGVVNERWFPEFDARREVARTLARELADGFVPFQAAFDRAVAGGSSPAHWAADGVHPTPQGHQLMADEWLVSVKGAQGS